VTRAFLTANGTHVLAQEKFGYLSIFKMVDGSLADRVLFDSGWSQITSNGEMKDRVLQIAIDPQKSLLAVSTELTTAIYLVDIGTLLNQMPAHGPFKLTDFKNKLEGNTGWYSTRFVGKRNSASLAELVAPLHPEEHLTDLAFCAHGRNMIAITDSGKVFGWNTSESAHWREPSRWPADLEVDLNLYHAIFERDVIQARFTSHELRGLACAGDDRMVIVGDEGTEGAIQL
jgi:hypothetical protein